MKKTLQTISVLFFTAIILLTAVTSFAQISVSSSNGYQVNVNVTPVAIVTNSSSCQWGYNYNVRLNYNVTITGSNRPSSLYTLQGTLGCESATHFFDLPNNAGGGSIVSTSNQWSSASDCNTATVSNKRCNLVNIEIEGPGISARTVSFAVSQPLSVKLESFAAIAERNVIKLKWTTATEINNDYFLIERSVDGSQWTEIKKVKGSGNSTAAINYEANDLTPLNGTTYYRLKQIDFDGTSSYSEAKAVKYITEALTGIIIFPIPNAGNSINLAGITDYTKQELSVLNAAGSVIYTTSISSRLVDLPVLKAGIYIIRVADKVSGQAQNIRYVKI